MAHPLPLTDAQVSRIVPFASIAGVVLFVAAATIVRWRSPGFGAPVDALVWAAIAIAAGGFVASRGVARVLPARDARGARNRTIVQVVLCEAGAALGAFAWLVTGDRWSWVAVGIGALGMLLAFPRRALPQANAASRMTR